MNALPPGSNGVFPDRSTDAVRAARTVDLRRSGFWQIGLKGLFVLIIGVALGIAGPYGMYDSVPLARRLGYWILILFIPWMLWEGLFALARSRLPQTLGARTLMALLMPIFAVIGSLFATSFSAGVLGLGGSTFTQAWAGSLASWLLFSFLIILPLALIADALSRHEQRKGGENLLGFFALKLPEKLRNSTLIALSSEGHYLRVFTSAGDDLILMTMEDAMTALSAYPGVRTHRSWWVAVDQIADTVLPAKITNALETHSGLRLPVSRRRRNAVREMIERSRQAGT